MMRLLTALSVAAFVAGGWPARVQNQNPTFRGGVRTVAVYATVQDRNGRLVPDLTRTDFEIRDNGRPVELTVFSNDETPDHRCAHARHEQQHGSRSSGRSARPRCTS